MIPSYLICISLALNPGAGSASAALRKGQEVTPLDKRPGQEVNRRLQISEDCSEGALIKDTCYPPSTTDLRVPAASAPGVPPDQSSL